MQLLIITNEVLVSGSYREALLQVKAFLKTIDSSIDVFAILITKVEVGGYSDLYKLNSIYMVLSSNPEFFPRLNINQISSLYISLKETKRLCRLHSKSLSGVFK